MYLPPYPVFPTLYTKRTALREVKASDVEDIVEISTYDGQRASTTADALQMLGKIERDYRNGDSVNWGIADPVTNEIMGTCGYYRGFKNDIGELGCILRPTFRGKGFMSEAMRAAVGFGIREMGLRRVIAITRQHNLKAIALLERLEFVHISQTDAEDLKNILSDLKEEQLLFLFAGAKTGVLEAQHL